MPQAVVVSFSVLLLVLLGATRAPAQYDGWQRSASFYILTTPEGANLPASAVVEDFPLLVRLQRDSFDFAQAQPHGEDLRFATAAGLALPYQIENWDAERGEAAVWVRVPKIVGNAQQELRMFYGKADAKSESNGKAVFNDANGYVSTWHLGATVVDEVGTLPSKDVDTTIVPGMIGSGRHFAGKQGIFCGDKIPNYPSGGSNHSTEAWFRAERPNATIIGWGNEGGNRGSKIRMLLRSPPHLHIDSDFSDVDAPEILPLNEWVHVVHTYSGGEGRIYLNGALAGSGNPKLDIKTPARLWLGGWYHNYDFLGDLDEVRVSSVARSADWIKLQYENQKTQHTAVGPPVRPGNELAVSATQLKVAEGGKATITAQAGGARKLSWVLKRNGRETVVATDRFSYTFAADRTTATESLTLELRAVYEREVKTKQIMITVGNEIPEPRFTLGAPTAWDGRQAIEVVPQIANLAEMQAAGADKLNYVWTVDGIAVLKQEEPGKLLLTRAQNSGAMRVSLAIDNGGAKITAATVVAVQEPPLGSDPWIPRQPSADERPEDNQFFARDDVSSSVSNGATNTPGEATLHYAGTLAAEADSVFLRVFADDQPYRSVSGKLSAEKRYALSVKLKPGLIKYRTEFGSKSGDRETVLHTAGNLVCGDAFLIIGQSNAVATDFGKENPLSPSEWIRTFGATDGSPQGSRLKLWAAAQARSPGGKSEIGYWGMELARRLVESRKVPICILNGAVGGTRIDQHQRNPADPTDVATIYGRLLWRVREAKLTHGIRAVFWHQGENDQNADGPTGKFGWETYRRYFIDLAAAWKGDYPNVGNYYTFQIWPKSCSMGTKGSDNRLREVQRTLPDAFSNLSVMSTLGIKPPGTCHFPKEGYAEFARLLYPLVQRHTYREQIEGSLTPANLKRAYFAAGKPEELVLEFDQEVVWNDALTGQFYLDGVAKQVTSGKAAGNRITLRLAGPSRAAKVTYLDSAAWSPDNLLYGANGIAALTFCEVPISAE
ncbi:MAG: DUF2341 domain-containing protein [Planctomycetia bacterium]|nr:DUF2341 domain-containing protein [Planctomycetia bacterium]